MVSVLWSGIITIITNGGNFPNLELSIVMRVLNNNAIYTILKYMLIKLDYHIVYYDEKV